MSTDQGQSTIILTDAAVAKVAELISTEGNPGVALRVEVRPGGCAGFNYEMFFDSDVADDEVVSSYGTFNVVVDSESASLLGGATLDFKDGLTDAGFSIENPNATGSCGCGNSFG
jgi:iron-sulfur cluster assembly protein/iron-sulfur cluster insertion protein